MRADEWERTWRLDRVPRPKLMQHAQTRQTQVDSLDSIFVALRARVQCEDPMRLHVCMLLQSREPEVPAHVDQPSALVCVGRLKA